MSQLTYPCIVGNRIVELTAEQRNALEWQRMSDSEKIASLLARVEVLERTLGGIDCGVRR